MRRADGLYPAHIWRQWQNTASARPPAAEDWHWQGRRRDGSAAGLEGQLHPLEDGQQGLGGLLCLAHAAPPDPAAVAPAPQWVEQALRELERRFREVLENVQLVAVTLDTAGNITFCNDFLLELTGWERAEVLGRNWHATFIPPDLRDRAWHLFQNDIAHNTIPAHHENDIQTRQGERRCISWNNTILRDPQGRLIGSASIGEDITARREADHALQASEARFRLMFTNNPIAMWVYDRESLRFLEVNEATCARYGYRRDELLTMGITDIRLAEDVPRLHAFLASHPPSVRTPASGATGPKTGG